MLVLAYLGVDKLFQQLIILGKWVTIGPGGRGGCKHTQTTPLATGLQSSGVKSPGKFLHCRGCVSNTAVIYRCSCFICKSPLLSQQVGRLKHQIECIVQGRTYHTIKSPCILTCKMFLKSFCFIMFHIVMGN